MMRLLLIPLIFSILLADWIASEDVDRGCPPIKCSESQSRKPTGLSAHCHCDDQCGDYHDCCSDAPNKTKSTNETLYTCTPLPTGAYFLKRYCPTGTPKQQIKCAQSANYSDHIEQMHLKIPLTLKSSRNVTYGNIFCAFCDNVTTANLTYWHLKVVCGTWSTVITNVTFSGPNTFLQNQPQLQKVLRFNSTVKTWQYVNGSAPANCSMHPQVPDSLRSAVRPCVHNLTSTCPADFLVPNITQKCAEFQSTVYQRPVPHDYRNAYCALCNGVPLRNLSCYVQTAPPMKALPSLYASLFRPARGPRRYRRPSGPKGKTERTYLYVTMQSDCANLLQNLELTKLKVETVVYRTMNRTYVRNVTAINGTDIQVCRIGNDSTATSEEAETSSTFFQLVVNVGCLSACTFLLLYIWNFFSARQPAPFGHKVTVSFVVATLLGNVGFLYASLSDQQAVCAIDGFVAYYGFLAAFLWLSAMTFDVCCSTWSCTFGQASVCSQNGDAWFMAYSLVGWTLPAVVAVPLAWGDHNSGSDSAYSDPNSDLAYSCSLNDRVALLWYFVTPLTVSVSANVALYSCAAFAVLTEEAVVEKMRRAGVEFGRHACLVATANAMWLAMVLTGYLANNSLVLLFTVADVLLCFAIFWSPGGKDVDVKSDSVSTNTNHVVATPKSSEVTS